MVRLRLPIHLRRLKAPWDDVRLFNNVITLWVSQDALRWGLVFLKRTRILSGFQFTTHFIDFVGVETKRFDGSTENVILTRDAANLRPALEYGCRRQTPSARKSFYFSIRIWYISSESKFRGESKVGLCERWGAGVKTQKMVRGEIGGWGRVPFNETYAPSLSTIYDKA